VSIEEEKLKAWFDAGVTCIGKGSILISTEILVRTTLGTIAKVLN